MGKLEKKKKLQVDHAFKNNYWSQNHSQILISVKNNHKSKSHYKKLTSVYLEEILLQRGNMLSLTILFLKLLMNMICITHFRLCAFLEVDFLPITKLNKLFKMYSHSIKPTLIHIRCRNKWWKVCYTLKAVC